MIKVENNQISVYSKINKDGLKSAIILFCVAFLWTGLNFIILRSMISMVLGVISLVLVGITFTIYKKCDGEKLKCSLSKDEFAIYSNKNIIKYRCDKIINFSIVNDNNCISLNYINEKGKKSSKIIMMQGCTNTEFVNLANEFLKRDIELNIENDNSAKYNTENNKNVLTNLMKNKEKIECTLLGKTKMFVLNGASYTLERIHSKLVFINEKNDIFEIDIRDAQINWNELSLKNKYEISYNKLKGEFIIEKVNETVDLMKVEELRNDIRYNTKVSFDEKQIMDEVSLYNNIIKISKIFGLITVLVCFSFFFSEIIFIIGTIIIAIVYPSLLLLYINKYKKEKLILK